MRFLGGVKSWQVVVDSCRLPAAPPSPLTSLSIGAASASPIHLLRACNPPTESTGYLSRLCLSMYTVMCTSTSACTGLWTALDDQRQPEAPPRTMAAARGWVAAQKPRKPVWGSGPLGLQDGGRMSPSVYQPVIRVVFVGGTGADTPMLHPTVNPISRVGRMKGHAVSLDRRASPASRAFRRPMACFGSVR